VCIVCLDSRSHNKGGGDRELGPSPGPWCFPSSWIILLAAMYSRILKIAIFIAGPIAQLVECWAVEQEAWDQELRTSGCCTGAQGQGFIMEKRKIPRIWALYVLSGPHSVFIKKDHDRCFSNIFAQSKRGRLFFDYTESNFLWLHLTWFAITSAVHHYNAIQCTRYYTKIMKINGVANKLKFKQGVIKWRKVQQKGLEMEINRCATK